jgi:hypothetical protein
MGVVYGQSIKDFYRTATERGFARDFQFRITAFRVNGLELDTYNLVFLKTANLPGKTISTISTPYMGLDFQIPGNVKFDNNNNWTVTFYCDQSYDLRTLLEGSMSDTFDESQSSGNMEPRDLTENIIQISLIDDQLEEVRVYNLLGAFITNIGEIKYNLTGSGAVQEVTASIAYQYWTTEHSSGIASGFSLQSLIVGQATAAVNNVINSLITNLGGR